MEQPTIEQMKELLNEDDLNSWFDLVKRIEEVYDVDQIWNKGFGDWIYEYKFRRGGKTLCTLYMKKNVATILITLGKAEQDKYESQRDAFSTEINKIYDSTKSLHDGKWLWIPINKNLSLDDILRILMIKRKPNKK